MAFKSLAAACVAPLMLLSSFACADDAHPPTTVVAPAPGEILLHDAPVIGTDVVYLRGGGMIRGVLVERLPDDHVTILLASGQTAVLPWALVDHFDVLPARVEHQTPAPPPPKPAPQFHGPMAFVHVDGGAPIELFYDRPEDGFAWEHVCDAPCDRELPLLGRYKVGGAGMRASEPFELHGAPGARVVLDVAKGTQHGLDAGGVTLGSGLAVSYFGALIALGNSGSEQSNHGGQVAGGLVVLTGLVVAGLGAAILGSNWQTDVVQRSKETKTALISTKNGVAVTPRVATERVSVDSRVLNWNGPQPRAALTVPLTFRF